MAVLPFFLFSLPINEHDDIFLLIIMASAIFRRLACLLCPDIVTLVLPQYIFRQYQQKCQNCNKR